MGEGARKTQKQAKQPADVEALVKAALAKERWAVEEIVDLVRPMVAMFSRRLIPDFSVADDLLQEVMVSLFTSLPGFDFDRDFTGWLRLVCRNKTIDMARKLDRLDEVLIDPDQLPDPRSIEQTRQGSELASALRRLPRDWGRVIALHHYAGLTFAEIGRLTGTPEKTWYSRYRRGTELLKELLEEEME